MKVKIGIMDLSAFDHSRVQNTMDMPLEPEGHAEKVMDAVEYWADKLNIDLNHFEFYSLEHTRSGFAEANKLGIHIINMSLSNTFLTTGEQMVKDKMLLITSAGNQGADGETPAATREEWLAVGAVDENLDPRYYSSHGLNKVVTVGIDGQNGRYGTSFASPYVALLCGEMYWRHHEALGYIPTNPKNAVQWVKFHSHDVFDEGFDPNTGYGLLKLPKRWEFEEWVYEYDNNKAVRRRVIDGEVEEKEVDLIMTPRNVNTRLYNQYAPMFKALGIPNGRSIMTVRDITKDRNIYYDGKVHISKVV